MILLLSLGFGSAAATPTRMVLANASGGVQGSSRAEPGAAPSQAAPAAPVDAPADATTVPSPEASSAGDVDPVLTQARQALQAGHPEQAESILRLRQPPASSASRWETLYLLAQSISDQPGRDGEAHDAWSRFLRESHDAPRRLRLVAENAIHRLEAERPARSEWTALRELEKQLPSLPYQAKLTRLDTFLAGDNPPSVQLQAWLIRAQEAWFVMEWREAARALERACELSPENAALRAQLEQARREYRRDLGAVGMAGWCGVGLLGPWLLRRRLQGVKWRMVLTPPLHVGAAAILIWIVYREGLGLSDVSVVGWRLYSLLTGAVMLATLLGILWFRLLAHAGGHRPVSPWLAALWMTTYPMATLYLFAWLFDYLPVFGL